MPNTCKTCQLDKKIMKQLEYDFVNGMNKYQLSHKYDVSYDSIAFHLNNHLPMKIAKGAELKSAQEGFNLLQKIDELYNWMSIIFQRNFDKKKDGMALKALAQQRHTLELLAKISYALHQNKVLEMEQEQQKFQDINRPIERLTKKEQELYFQLNRKLLGEDVRVDLSEFSDYKEVREDDEVDSSNGNLLHLEEQNTTKKLVRTKFQPNKPEPEQEETTDEPMRFKPFVDSVPPKSNRSRRDFDYFMRKKNPSQYSSGIKPQFIPVPGYRK